MRPRCPGILHPRRIASLLLQVAAVLGGVVGPACGPSSPAAPPAVGSAAAPGSDAEVDHGSAAPAPAPAPPTTCAADADCNFAEDAPPARCVVGPAPAAGKQPAKPDGSCVCLDGACALRPNGPRISQQACDYALDHCALVVATARCEPGIDSSDRPRGRADGPSCACDRGDQRCHLRWFDPVPCKTADDCWSTDKPVVHAIPRPAKLRGRAFRGCVDGEHVPKCVDGRCALDGLTC